MSEKVRVSGELSETLPGQAPAAVSGALRLPRAARAMTRWGRLALRSCLATGRPVIRHPWRTAAVVALLALIGFGALAAGVNFWVSDHLRASRAAVERHHNLDAMPHVQACLDVWPRHGEALLLAARVAGRLETFAEAEQFLERYQAAHGKDDDLFLEHLLLRAERGEVDEVSDIAQALVKQNHPATLPILEALVQGHVRMLRLRDAQASLQLWRDRQPDSPQTFYWQGLIYERRARWDEALGCYRRATDFDPDHDEARQKLSWLLLQMTLCGEALAHLEHLQRRQPENLMAQVYLARCHDQLGDQEEAARILDALLARQPDYQPALRERGRLALHAGQLPQAEGWLRQAVRLQPGDYESHYVLFQCLQRRGKGPEVEGSWSA